LWGLGRQGAAQRSPPLAVAARHWLARRTMRGELQGLTIPDHFLPVAVAVVVGLISAVLLFQFVSTARLRARFPSPTRSELEEDATCKLCRKEMSLQQLQKGNVKQLPRCGHCFHLECLSFWMTQKGNIIAHRCPSCRAMIADEDADQTRTGRRFQPQLRPPADQES
jgi:hypothetical protein